MSNSALVNYVKISPHKTSPRTSTITKITIHHMAGNLTVESCGECFMGTRKASSNYSIGSDGRVGMYVEEKDRAWTSSNQSNDDVAITIEVADDTNRAPWHSSDAAMAKLILLCADICRRNGINKLTYTGTKSGNLTLHNFFTNTACPGEYLEALMPTIASEVNNLIESGETTYTWNGTLADGVLTEVVYGDTDLATLNIDISKFTPYVVAVEPSVTSINYDDLKLKQVTGMMFEAGCLFNSIHMQQPFRNKNLKKQVEDCNKAGLRFALYSIVRSRTLSEAKEECKQLYYTVSKYPPGMGIWLQLEFPGSQRKSRNHEILDYYLDRLEAWGLSQGCGLYVTKDQLETINWDRYQDKFLLWYKYMMTSESEYSQVQGLMYPEFFQLNPKDPASLPVISNADENFSGVIDVNTGLAGNTKGEQIANYACQFIGNPYVWGGTSLTKGADCSGFTQSVFANFGISLPRSSSSQRSAGRSVTGLSAALPGDLICYSGHVAIYIGNNKIVHASNSKPYPQGGIKISSPANYTTILAIRRCW